MNPGDERIGPAEAQWRGQRGAKGDTGQPGLSPSVRRGLVGLFALCAVLAAIAALSQVRADIKLNRQQQAISRQQREIDAQDRKAARIRCGSIEQIVSIPIPVPVTDNPSRQWVLRYAEIQRNRGMKLGCHLPPLTFVHSKGH
ncbi:MAG TPA: hypothetical protein VIZ43_08580 [Trebonia sp.]